MNTTTQAVDVGFTFDNTFARELEGAFAAWPPEKAPNPRLIKRNHDLCAELGLHATALDSPLGAAIFSGNELPPGATPIAQAYAGHQFGGFSPQLGDGRALLLGEVIDRNGKRRDIAFKGSGRTPFSRGGDGKAALGPVLREYIIGEAMYALGIPTTRALAAVATGEPVLRESGALPGAVLTRVASSHIRVGTFQYFAARQDEAMLRRLADYVINRHDPALKEADNPYVALLQAVSERQAALIARWMGVGFIHGVMNTDNMTVSGETIDYGPCAFMEKYAPGTVYSSIDRQGRYAYANQPLIARWNIARMAECLLPLLHADAHIAVTLATEVIDAFPARYEQAWLATMRRKLGLNGEQQTDLALATDLLKAMEGQSVDFTLAFYRLADAAEGQDAGFRSLFKEPDNAALAEWLARWRERIAGGTDEALALRQINPAYIPRNHLVEEALDAATQREDLAPFEALLAVVKQPFGERPGLERYATPATLTEAAGYQTFCGT